MTEPSSLGEFGALVHVLHRRGGDVEIGPFELARRGLRPVHRLHAVEEAVAPVHERLGVDVLIVLGEVEAALQRLVDDAPVVAAGKPELRLHRRSKQRTAEFVEPLALDHNAGGRPLERLHIGHGQAHVLEPQGLERLEAEHVADDRSGEIGDRARLEEVEVVGDVGEVLARRIGHGIDAIALRRDTCRHAVSRSVHTTVQVAVELSPATAAAASVGSTPSCGVTRKSAMTSVSFGA